MGIAIGLILLLAALVVGLYDTYVVQRDYADMCAARHGHIPPLVDWFFVRDTDVEVDRLRRFHRNLYILDGLLAAAAAIVILVARATTPS